MLICAYVTKFEIEKGKIISSMAAKMKVCTENVCNVKLAEDSISVADKVKT